MESARVYGYIASLEQVIRHRHLDLREAMTAFQELCHRISPERAVPMGIVNDIRQAYNKIQDQLIQIRAINDLFETKYRRFHHRNYARNREVAEFAFLAKSLYSKFEHTLQEIEVNRRLRDTGRGFGVFDQRIPLGWFHSKVHQIILLRNLQHLQELDYKTWRNSECEQRREVIRNGTRSVSLFVLSGEAGVVDLLQSHIRLREYDVKERYARNELRGALTHLREISLPEVAKVIGRFTESSELSKLRCVLMSIQSERDLERAISGFPEKSLQGMIEGELRTLSIQESSLG